MAIFICTNTCFLHSSKNGLLKELYQNIFVNVFVTRILGRNKELNPHAMTVLTCSQEEAEGNIHINKCSHVGQDGVRSELGSEAITCLLAKDQERKASHISGLFEFNDHSRMGSHSHIRKAGIVQTACLRGSDWSGSGMYLKDRKMSWWLMLPA